MAVHLKIDTGMHRVGCTPASAVALVEQIAAHDELTLGGVCTHLAVADEPDDDYTAEQLAAFDAVLAELDARGLLGDALVHAANSAGTLAWPCVALRPRARRHLRLRHPAGRGARGRGRSPARDDAHVTRDVREDAARGRPPVVRAALRARTRGARSRPSPPGTPTACPATSGLSGGEVLIGGRRYPIAGIVTMDQLMVDVGDAPVEAGDEVVLLGAQGDDEVTALEWADHLGTISYEIVTGIGARVPRRYRG